MITNKALVKILADLYMTTGDGKPENTTAGTLFDVYLDVDKTSSTYGNTYVLTAITGVDPALEYTWVQDKKDDAKIDMKIARAEKDYLAIRNAPFESDGINDLYPDGSDDVVAEMACYLLGLGNYQGRGQQAESLGDRSQTHDTKISGYPVSIVGTITRYQSMS